MHSAQKDGKKQQKTKKRRKEQRNPRDASAITDRAVLKLKRKAEISKICGGPFAEEGKESSKNGCVPTEQVDEVKKELKNVARSLCRVREHNEGQEVCSRHVPVDRDPIFDETKPEPKKVRFSDEFVPCKCGRHVSGDVCSLNNNAPKESLAKGCAEFTVSCSCKRENSKDMPSQNSSTNSNPGKARLVNPLTCTRQTDEDDKIWGKRFTPEEDELIKNAILEYIKVKRWEEREGIAKVMNCRKHKEAHNCWDVIRLCLPHRPLPSIRTRARLLYEEGRHLGRWSKEEEELLRRLHKEHGSRWVNLSALIGRCQKAVNEKWRYMKRSNPTGIWTWEEMQQLSDLVHEGLRLKALDLIQNGQGSRRILHDNVNWDKIADAIGTHNHGSCCKKWYSHLSSSMVVDGLWASEDDYLLLKSLLESGACTEEEVEWQRLLNHRSGQTCFVRWKQMVKHLGENRTRAFLEKLDCLVHRYAPELLLHAGFC